MLKFCFKNPMKESFILRTRGPTLLPLLVPALSCHCSAHMPDLQPKAANESCLHAFNQVSQPGVTGTVAALQAAGKKGDHSEEIHLSILTTDTLFIWQSALPECFAHFCVQPVCAP